MNKSLIESSPDTPESRQYFGAFSENDEFYQHWSPVSQSYAPVEILLRHLSLGWTLDGTVAFDKFYYGSGRRTRIYYFRLLFLEESVWIPVLENPVVLRLIRERGLNRQPAAPRCGTNAAESKCRVCGDPAVDPNLNRRCQDGCNCPENSALRCCCEARLLSSE